MVFKGKFSVTGGKEVAALLKKVPAEIGEKMMKQASWEASQLVRDAIKRAAPKREGRIEHFIGRTAFFDRNSWQIVVRVGMINFTGKGATERRRKALAKMKLSKDAYYARFVNEGTKHQRAQKFFQRGFQSSMHAYSQRMVTNLRTRVDRYYTTRR